MDDCYIAWDFSAPGISFNMDRGRITIFKTTLVAMGHPEFFHFLFSPEDLVFGIEPCNIDDGGAKRLPDNLTREHYDIRSKDLVRFVFQTCGWQNNLTYRVAGEQQTSGMVYFDLRQALEVHEGKLRETR